MSMEDNSNSVTYRKNLIQNQKEVATAAFLGIECGFNNVSMHSINSALRRQEINKTIRRWIQEMLISKEILVDSNGDTINLRATKWYPQGGVLSPLIWNLVVVDLIRDLNE